ncbi:MAG: MarR family transcriptional regulator [Actinomycetota bacterium]|nr:MarR family transcriptional regulator [Actinomycetota bacterium]
MSSRETLAAAEVWRLLLDVAMSQFGRVAGIAQDLGLTPGHVKALLTLDPGHPRAMGALAQSFSCDASTMTWLVDRLEERGLVERGGLEGDRRVKTVALTPNGVRTKAELEERLYEPPRVFCNLAPRELEAVRDVLQELASEIDRQPQAT